MSELRVEGETQPESRGITDTRARFQPQPDTEPEVERIAVVGLSPASARSLLAFAQAGFHVVGTDPDTSHVARFREGLGGPDASTAESSRGPAGAHSRFELAADAEDAIATADLIVVPAQAAGQDSGETWMEVAAVVGRGITRGAVVCFENLPSIAYAEQNLLPVVEAESGLTRVAEFGVAFRFDPMETRTTPQSRPRPLRVFAGLDDASYRLAQRAYAKALGVHIRRTTLSPGHRARATGDALRLGLAHVP